MIKNSKSLCVAAVIISSLALVGCFDNSADQYLVKAKVKLESNDSDAAIIQLKNALQKNPSLAEARFLLGKALLDGGDAVSADIELRKAQELGYDSDQLMPLQAKAMLLKGFANKVVAEYGEKLPKLTTDQSALQTVLAMAYRALGKNDQAQQAIEKAVRADPKNIQAKIYQIRLGIGLKGIDGASAGIEKVIGAVPGNSEAWQLKGDILQVEGKSEAALAAYREAILLEATNLAAQSQAVWLLIGKGDIPAAELQLKGLRAVFPSLPQTKFLSAVIALDKGDLKTAKELTQELLKSSPDNVSVLQLDGAVALRSGSLTQAEASLTKALQISPDNVRIRLLLAQSQLREGDPAKVIKTLQSVVDSPDAWWESVVLMAQAWQVSGDIEKASIYFERAAKLNPADAGSRTALALAQIDKGLSKQGLDELKSISATDPGNMADLALINAQIKKREFDGALAAISRLEKKDPEQPAGPYLRGQVLLMIGDRQKARKSFNDALNIAPKYFPASAGIAAMDVADGSPELAQQRFEKLMVNDPSDLRPAMALVEVKVRLGATNDQLADTLVKIIERNPTAVAPRVRLLSLQLERANFKAAVVGAQQALSVIPDNPVILEMLAQAQYLSGDVNQALSNYIKIAALRPNSPQPYMNMGNIHLLQKDSIAAAQDFKRAISIKPDYFPAHRALIEMETSFDRMSNALAMVHVVQKQPGNEIAALLLEGDIYAEKKQWANAAKFYKLSLDKKPEPGSIIKWHRALVAAGLVSEAQKAEAQWLITHPDEPSFLYYLGDIALAKSEYAVARQRYEAVVKVAPNNALALNNLAWLLSQEKNPDALNYALKANKAAPKTPAFMDTLAQAFADSGQMSKAIEVQLEAVSLAPDAPEFRLHLAKIYVQGNDKAKAKEQLVRLVDLGDKFSGQTEVKAMLAGL